MRALLPVLCLGLSLAACRCGPDEPTAVTLAVRNTDALPIYVAQGDRRLGLAVLRRVSGQWQPFAEEPLCECLACDLVCGGCACDLREPALVMKLAPGQMAERVWGGVVQTASTGSCSGAIFTGPFCLRAENPPLDELFLLRLCYSPQVRGAEDAAPGVAVPGSLAEGSILCTEKTFRVEDLRVEISPSRGAACQAHPDCQGADELCFAGACTTACPDLGARLPGGSWRVFITEPTMGEFFSWTRQGELALYEGTGTVGSVRYENNIMTLQLRTHPGAQAGSVSIGLPEGVAVPISVGETLQVQVVDASSRDNPENRAVVIRDAQGQLLLAADTGQQGRILADGAISPFTLSAGDEVVGCAHDECGKSLFRTWRFSSGEKTFEVAPGRLVTVVAGQASWTLVNVAHRSAPEGACFIHTLTPWVIAHERP
jgi:hypothetical protein